jgi:hypothetical protein
MKVKSAGYRGWSQRRNYALYRISGVRSQLRSLADCNVLTGVEKSLCSQAFSTVDRIYELFELNNNESKSFWKG